MRGCADEREKWAVISSLLMATKGSLFFTMTGKKYAWKVYDPGDRHNVYGSRVSAVSRRREVHNAFRRRGACFRFQFGDESMAVWRFPRNR